MNVIVMTGATSGIGAEAMKRLVSQPNTLIIIGARGINRIVPEGTEVFPLDVSSLESVRVFSDAVKQRLGNAPIDQLILNAGAQFGGNKQRSVDGFEMTFATNHLSHYLLARLLWPNMAVGSRIVFTNSDTHDPATVPFGPKTLDPVELAHPTKNSQTTGMQAYPSSKLCNLLTARSLAALSIKEKRDINLIAYNPGLTGGTAFGGKPSPVMRVLLPVLIYPIFRLLSVFKPSFLMGTAECAGESLAALAMATVVPPKGRIYASLVRNKITYPDPSVLAQRDDARDLLWQESAEMVGLPE